MEKNVCVLKKYKGISFGQNIFQSAFSYFIHTQACNGQRNHKTQKL